MTIGELNAMAIVLSGDSLLRKQRDAFDALLEAEKRARASENWAECFRERIAVRLLDAEAVCQEFGALGAEC